MILLCAGRRRTPGGPGHVASRLDGRPGCAARPWRPGRNDSNSGCRRPPGTDRRHAAPVRRRVQIKLGDRPAGGRDLVAGAAGEGVRADGQRDAVQVAVAEHLDQLVAPDRAGRDQLVRADRAALGEQPGQVAHVHHLVLDAEPVLEALELGQPHVQRHLPALEGGDTVLRALVPLVPRPAVLPPLPPSPRPTRVLSVLAPGAGRRWWILIGRRFAQACRPPRPSPGGDGVDHAADLRGVVPLDRLADLAQARARAAWRAGSACTRWCCAPG